MPSPTSDTLPVAIVGGGPVGLTLSLELSRQRVRHVLLSASPDTSGHPKCNTTNARSMEHFRRLGVAAALRRHGLPLDHPTDIVYLNRLAGFEIARLRLPSAAAVLAGATEESVLTPEPLHRISQRYLEPILLDAARSSAYADIRFGWTLDTFIQDDESVVLDTRDVRSGAGQKLTARRLVGCDGARSAVRRAIGIELTGSSGTRRQMLGGPMLSTFYRSEALAALLPRERGFLYWTVNPELRSLTFAIDGKALFLTHFPLRDDDDRREFEAMMPRIVGRPIDCEVLSSERWMAGYSLVAERFGAGRVLIAGDAAHLFTPTGGFGMNTGIEDAANLGWKLAAVEQGWGGDALLSSYEAERRPIALRNTDAARAIADRIGHLDVPADLEHSDGDGGSANGARERLAGSIRATFEAHFNTIGVQLGARYDGSALIQSDGSVAPVDRPERYEPTGTPGGRAPHVALPGGAPLFDRFGIGFTLVRIEGVDASSIEAAARERGVPLTSVVLDGTAAADFTAAYGGAIVLIRPDQIVAWRGDTAPDDAMALVDRVRGAA